MTKSLMCIMGALWASGTLSACHSGGGVTESLSPPSTSASISAPLLVQPSQMTYHSRASTLVLSGLCQSNAVVYLSGTETQSTNCINSTFSFTLNRNQDGLFPYFLSQSIGSGFSTNPTPFLWVRKTSVAPPSIVSPATQPYRSGLSTITIVGSCETGASVRLSGATTQTATCSNSQFIFPVTRLLEGTFDFQITQEDAAGNTASIPFQWVREDLRVTPPSAQINVATDLVFSISGGSGNYTTTMQTNASTATLNTTTRTYTAGSLANVVDVIRVQDSDGLIYDLAITTKPGLADHIRIPTAVENLDPFWIASVTSPEMQAQVTDRFGNPVSSFWLDFLVAGGDSTPTALTRVMTDSQGLAKLPYRLGQQLVRNRIRILPSSGVLPDLALTGGSTQTLELRSKVSAVRGEIGTQFSTSSSPGRALVHDWNGDGRPDVAVLNRGEPSIGIFQGRGNGLFDDQLKIRPLCAGPSDMRMADLNQDSKMDLVVTCPGSDRIALFLNDTGFTFLPMITLLSEPGESLPVALELADVNQDNRLDLITTSSGGSVVSVRRGMGNGTFQAPVSFNVGANPSAVFARDFDRDGNLDLVVLNSSDNQFMILLGDGTGQFTNPTFYSTGVAPADLQVADLNADNFVDIVVVNGSDSNVMIFLNDGFGSFTAPITYPVGQNPSAIAIDDLQGDNKPDLVVSSGDESSVTRLLGQGDGTFIVQPDIATYLNPISLIMADLNQDSKKDLIVLSNSDSKMQVLLGTGTGELGLTLNLAGSPSDAVSYDYDLDGIPDLVVTYKSTNTVQFLKGDGKGLFLPTISLPSLANPLKVITTDFDQDGKTDLVVLHENIATLRLFRQGAGASFEPPVDLAAGPQPSFVVSRDLNFDSYPELIVSNQGNNTVSVLINDGTGQFSSKADFQVSGSKPVALAVGDLNSDERLDIVTVNQESSNISVLLASGTPLQFQPSVQFETASGGNSIVLAYLNLDGFLDIAVASESEGMVSVLMGQGTGAFSSASQFSAGQTPQSLQAGDFNGDQFQDLLVSNSAEQKLTLLLGQANGQFPTSKSFNLNHSGDVIKVYDINSDKAVDVLSFDRTLNSVKVWLGH